MGTSPAKGTMEFMAGPAGLAYGRENWCEPSNGRKEFS